ncbi:high mobility group protein B1-like [Lytechinus pictus]|uniref:high mobility group protein B1-like n=1 Tax=Lytechinus pictus TaxID=7653 RepID=UPI0030BA1792
MMSCAKFPDVVTRCTLELCSANFVLGLILCKCGLALDTKIVWTDDGLEAEALGTGLDLSEGFAVGALGMKIGIIDKKKRDKKWKKKRQRWQKKKKKGKKSKDEENEEEEDGEEDEEEEEEEDEEESEEEESESDGSDE